VFKFSNFLKGLLRFLIGLLHLATACPAQILRLLVLDATDVLQKCCNRCVATLKISEKYQMLLLLFKALIVISSGGTERESNMLIGRCWKRKTPNPFQDLRFKTLPDFSGLFFGGGGVHLIAACITYRIRLSTI